MCIEELKENEATKEHFVEAQTMQKDAREEKVVAKEKHLSTKVQLKVQQATKVQTTVEAQQKAMEMEQHEAEAIAKRRCVILDRTTLLEKGIKILDLERFMWTWTKKNYDKHIKQMENQKDIAKEEDWA